MTYLLVDDGTETSLALDDGVGDAHLAAERRKEDDELNGVDVLGDEDKRSLLVLDETLHHFNDRIHILGHFWIQIVGSKS